MAGGKAKSKSVGEKVPSNDVEEPSDPNGDYSLTQLREENRRLCEENRSWLQHEGDEPPFYSGLDKIEEFEVNG